MTHNQDFFTKARDNTIVIFEESYSSFIIQTSSLNLPIAQTRTLEPGSNILAASLDNGQDNLQGFDIAVTYCLTTV